MPCLNEARTVGVCVETALAAIAAGGLEGEVVVADNGSTDGSQEAAAAAGARVVDAPVRGYGAALMAGIEASAGRFIIMGDSDASYDFSHLMPFVEGLRDGHDLVMGSRFKGRIEPKAMPWKHRWIGNPVLTGLGRLFFRAPVSDFHCGLRAFTRAAYERMDLRTTGMEFASEMVVKATLCGMRIAEVPITLRQDGREGASHLRSWRDGWRHLRFMLLYSPRWLFLVPGAVLLALGVAGFAWLLPGPRRIGGAEFDVHTLLASGLACLMGFQLVLFGALATAVGVSSGLLPRAGGPPRWVKAFRSDVSSLAGLVLFVAGLALMVTAVIRWGRADWGPLQYRYTMRLVIPAVTLMSLGVQSLFSSFFLAFLMLPRRSSGAPE